MIHWDAMAPHDVDIIRTVVGARDHGQRPREPDEIISPEGTPYIFRWHVVPRRAVGANVYLHLQVADDPERPLHDHPWDNQSVILAGGYVETYQTLPPHGRTRVRVLRPGDTAQRLATEAHRLRLIPDEPNYSISLFSTGPVIREWGFWVREQWIDYRLLREIVDGQDRIRKGALDEENID